MNNLVGLLNIWQQWNVYDVMTHARGDASAEEPTLGALDALRASHELVELLTGRQWQAVYSVHREGAGWDRSRYNADQAEQAGPSTRLCSTATSRSSVETPGSTASSCGR